jgi:hypothetical protein
VRKWAAPGFVDSLISNSGLDDQIHVR